MHKRSATFALLLALIEIACIARGSAAATGQVSAHVDAALEKLRRYEVTHDEADLRAAISGMGAAAYIWLYTPENFLNERRTLVAGYAQIIAAIFAQTKPSVRK